MSKVKVTLNRLGVRALLKSEKMQEHLASRGQDIASRCGDGYQHDVYVGKTRANVMVFPATYQANSDNKKNNTILKAVRG